MNENPIKPLKILIVEDEEYSCQLITLLTRKFAKEIFTTTSGEGAVEICRNNPDLDLILMDIQMPGMDGYEATRLIREFNQEVIIIAQTAYALSGDREMALEAGCTDYLSKPIKRDNLYLLIEKHFGA